MRKRLVHQVTLDINEDDHGCVGFVRSKDLMEGFNALWNGIGIFHDVFEHYFEGDHKYFRGKYAYNLAGEIAAMSACMYFRDELWVSERVNNTLLHYTQSITGSISSDLISYAIYGETEYGSELLCAVPYQKPTYSHYVEDMIDRVMDQLRKAYSEDRCSIDEDSREAAEVFSRSITAAKIRRLVRYGYRMAKRKFGEYSYQKHEALNKFITYWDGFCKTHDAEHLRIDGYFSADFRIYLNSDDELFWKVKMVSDMKGMEPIVINSEKL